MGRLTTLTALMTLGSWAAATHGAVQEGPPSAASRPPAPVPPVEYLRAGSMLFNNGQYDLATKYLSAADDYRDQLSPAEQSRLDEYKAAMAQVTPGAPTAHSFAAEPTATAAADPGAMKAQAVGLMREAREAAGAGRMDEAVQMARQADSINAPFATGEDSPAHLLAELQTQGRGYPLESKSAARWLLRSAREDAARGDFETAQAKVDKARGQGAKWSLFDDTPDKVQKLIDQSRPAAAAGMAAATPPPGSRREQKAAAGARLKAGRLALESGNFDQAEALAAEVAAWKLSYGAFEDSPEKLAAACRAVKRREGIRDLPPAAQPSQSTYDLLVQEARALMAQGQFDQAEQKAQHAMRLNVVPPVTADRAEAVLGDLQVARVSATPEVMATAGAPAESPLGDPGAPLAAAEPPHVALEREADRLLAAGDTSTAAKKFAEAQRLRSQSLGDPFAAPAPSASRPQVDPALVAAGDDSAPPIPDVMPTAAPLGDDAAPPPPAPMPSVPALDPLLVAGDPSAPPSDVDPALQAMDQARALFANGNYVAARDAAEQAKLAGANPGEVEELVTQTALAEQASALKLYDAAVAAVRAQDFGRARALLNEVANLGASLDDSTNQRVQDLLLKLPNEAEKGAAPIDAEMDAQALKAQQMNAEVGTKVAEARRLLETDPDQALKTLQTTIAAVQAAGLSEPVTKTMVRRLEVAIELAKKDKAAFDSKMADKGQREEVERTKLRILEADTAKQKQIKEMMDKALTADADGDYDQAELWAKRVLAIDPNEVSAIALATVTRTKSNFERYTRNQDAKERGFIDAMNDVDAAGTIDTVASRNGISYPETFAQLTADRGKYLDGESVKSAEVMALEKKLNEPITLNMPDGTLDEAMNFIRNYAGVNVVLDHKALMDQAITKDAPVELVAQDMPLRVALKFLLSRHGLSFRTDDGVLLITTPQSSGQTYVKVYQVADLVLGPKTPEFHSGAFAGVAGNSTNETGPNDDSANAAAIGGTTLPGSPNSTSTPPVTNGSPTVTYSDRKVDFGPLLQLLTSTIAPGTWEISDPSTGQTSPAGFGLSGGLGGGDGGLGGDEPPIGTITPFILNISLIIRHTAEVHDDIVDLLRQLRRLQDLQVSVEVRFITVNDDFFEAIGVDFDFAIQSDIYGKGSSFATPNPAAVPTAPGGGGTGGGGGGGGAGGFTPPFLVNPNRWYSLGNRQPVVAGINSNGGADYTSRATGDLNTQFVQDSVTPALALSNITPGAGATFGLAFLSDLEVYLFLTALQGDTRTNVVQAPKVTTFNGAQASIIDQTTQNLVTTLTPVVNAGAVAFQPQVTSIPSGVQLQVTPVVTADRRYVRLTLSPFFQVLRGVDTFSFGGGAVGGGGLGGGAANLTTSVQLPIISTTAVLTTVTVPDGGTVLLGGVKRLTEQRLEYGTPILSKTPMINRLFRNIGIGRTTDSLMLMVTPRIIILEEEEEKLGIPAVPAPGFP